MADKKLGIDLNRGVRMSKDPLTKLEVYMYLDSPGVYLTPLGGEVPAEIAARAGYEVEKLGKLRERREKLMEFEAQLDEQMNIEADRKVLYEGGGYKLVAVGGFGNAMVLDEDDNALVPMPMPVKLAKGLFEKLAPGVIKHAKVRSLAEEPTNNE